MSPETADQATPRGHEAVAGGRFFAQPKRLLSANAIAIAPTQAQHILTDETKYQAAQKNADGEPGKKDRHIAPIVYTSECA